MRPLIRSSRQRLRSRPPSTLARKKKNDDLLRALRSLDEQTSRFNAALVNMPHGLCMFDDSKALILCNPAYAELYALPPELTVSGTLLSQILEHRLLAGHGPIDIGSYFDTMDEAHEKHSFRGARVELQDGRTIQMTHNPMPGGGYVSTHEDVTDYIVAEQRIRHLASHDALTGMPNRMSFAEKLSAALKRANRDDQLAVLCLDLDRFKAVNDTFGHATGDLLLQSLNQRFAACTRDIDTVARHGGDEFVVLQVGIRSPDDVRQLARRLIEMMSVPFHLGCHQVQIGVSIGIALAPHDGVLAVDLFKNADIALYRAKAEGRNTFRFFEFAMDSRLQARRRLEIDLRSAIAAKTLELHYQPLVDASDGKLKGFEALLRWTHPELGPISPADFIPIAEESGMIVPLGRWVLWRACQDAAGWPDDLSVAVNLSSLQFQTGDLIDAVRSAILIAGIAPARLELEITKSVLLVEDETTLATLHKLRDLGTRIALDDFGTGYSSLSYLIKFPFDKIKIDRLFVSSMAENDGCAAIIKAVAGLGTGLNMITTAEGVETTTQLQHVRESGCDQINGYLYGAARSAREALMLIRNGFPVS